MKNFPLKSLLALLFGCWSSLTFGQNNLGHHTDNYSGVYSLSYNPAEIVDSRYSFHMNIVGAGFTVSNNYLGIKRSALFSDRSFAFEDPDFSDNYLVERLNGKRKGVYVSGEVVAPLSFMANFGKEKSHAMGFSMRLRTHTNVNGVDENLATMSYNELLLSSLYNVGIQNENFSIQSNTWAEYGITYGTTLLNTGKHFVSFAGTAKLTQGLANTYFYSDNLDVTFPSDSTVTVTQSDLRFGYSSILGTNINDIGGNATKGTRFGVGLDVGAVWEFRPKVDNYKYGMDGNPDYLDPRKEKYKVKVGLGIIDMGFTPYQRDNGVFGEYFADLPDIDIEETFGAAFEDFENSGLQGFEDTLASIFNETSAKKGTYNVSLPMRINAYLDYNLWKNFYANLGASIAPGFKKNPEKTRGISEFSLTPRYEHKWFALYLPLSMNTLGNMHFGTGVRLGPLSLGTNDILPLFAKSTIYDANVYMNLSIPIAKKLKDKDGDHVSKKNDECKKEAGTWETKGCPDQDRDDDGILDNEDECPDVPGIKKFNGCPDTDGDGISDMNDKCPEEKGIEAFAGCPDSDEDGIQDSEDDCPTLAGLEEFNGCPDTDGDGIKDSEDACPTVAGPIENNGCPYDDDDNDGILNKDDVCPKVFGLAEFNGCPDTDGDGLQDSEDDCPLTAGPIENKGCPVIEKEVEEALDLAFKNLEFESGKAIIKSSSFSSLEELAEILDAHPDYILLIEGHTDNVGSEASNQVLSEMRANAVKTLIVEKGISPERIQTEAYGETRPVASNETAAGRQENRRVELTIVFE